MEKLNKKSIIEIVQGILVFGIMYFLMGRKSGSAFEIVMIILLFLSEIVKKNGVKKKLLLIWRNL